MSTSYQHEDQDAMGLAKEHKLQRELDQQNRDSAINRAMAEVAGWKGCADVNCEYRKAQHLHKNGVVGFPEWYSIPRYPNYLKDLNAVHEIEVSLPIMQLARYRGHLACQFTDHPEIGRAHV